MKKWFFSMRFDLVVGLLLSLLGIIAFLTNLYALAFQPEQSLSSPFVAIALIVIGLFILFLVTITYLSWKKPYPYADISKALQIFILLLNSFISILDSYENSYGIALFFMATLLAFKYKMINIYRILFLGVSIILVTILSAYLDGRIYSSLASISFSLFFLFLTAYAYRDSVSRINQRNKVLQALNQDLEKELKDRDELSSQLTALRLDVEEFSFTPAEKELIEYMCLKGVTSNKDLANCLFKSESTVKTQMYSIFNKTGIHKRTKLIAFFKDL